MAPSLKKTWLMDKGTWPLFGVTAVAVGLVSFHVARHLFTSPDVFIGKDARKSVVRDNHAEGKSFFAHGVRLSSVERVPHIFSGLNAKYGTAHDDSHLPENKRKAIMAQLDGRK